MNKNKFIPGDIVKCDNEICNHKMEVYVWN